jgi:hypothetical protein
VVVDLNDVLMVQRGRGGGLVGGGLFGKELDGYVPALGVVYGSVDRPHAPLPEGFFEFIAIV